MAAVGDARTPGFGMALCREGKAPAIIQAQAAMCARAYAEVVAIAPIDEIMAAFMAG
jgi:hypothetical protein